jgi:hypothetical protein
MDDREGHEGDPDQDRDHLQQSLAKEQGHCFDALAGSV